MMLIFVHLLSIFILHSVHGEKTENVSMPSLVVCDGSMRQIDAVNISSVADSTYEQCTITYKADLDYLMIGYIRMSLACGQTIKLYYGKSSLGYHEKEFDCRTQTYEIKDFIYVPGRYLTVQFDKPKGPQLYEFSMVITSYNKDFFCDSSDEVDCYESGLNMCVDSDVECDGVTNCPSGKDEDLCEYAADMELATPVAIGVVVTVIVISILACIGCIVGIVCCCQRCGRRNQGAVIRQPQQVVVQQPANVPVQPPPVYYPTGPQQPPPGGYQPVPVAPPTGDQGYPPAAYNPNYMGPSAEPTYQNQPTAPYPTQAQAQAQAPYPTQAQAQAPPPPYNPSMSPPVNYNPQTEQVKVPL